MNTFRKYRMRTLNMGGFTAQHRGGCLTCYQQALRTCFLWLYEF